MVPKETHTDEMRRDETQRDETQSDFGPYLQACRLASGRSLNEIAQQTKINRSCLLQIENQELDNLPQAVFVKGFLRTYADAVGGDAAEALRRYDNCCGIQQKMERDEGASSDSTKFWFRIVFVLILLSGAVLVTLYAVNKVKSADNQRLQPVAAEDNANHANPQPGPQATDHKGEVAVPEGRAASLNLRISAVAYCRLKIISDAGLPQEFELQAGEQVAVTAEKHFNLLIGNAAGIRLMLNDKPVAIQGKRDQVVTLNLP